MAYHRKGTRAANMLRRAGLDLSLELQQRALKKVRDVIDLGNHELYDIDEPMEMPAVEFDLTGRCGGMAHYGLKVGMIQINPGLLVKYPDRVIDVTIPHEVAHLFVYHIHGSPTRVDTLASGKKRRIRLIEPHGLEWERVMRALGIMNPSRTHAMDTEHVAKTKRTVTYMCPSPCSTKFELSLKRHTLIQRHNKQYTCIKCRKAIYQYGVPEVVKKVNSNVPVDQLTKIVSSIAGTPPSKMDHARLLVGACVGLSRGEVLEILMHEIGIKQAHASTYYAIIMKENANK